MSISQERMLTGRETIVDIFEILPPVTSHRVLPLFSGAGSLIKKQNFKVGSPV